MTDAATRSSGDDSAGALEGVRILDLTSVLMGPFATQMLGDMGADVIKIETRQGDTTRWIGAARHPGMGAGFMQCNRNKRGIVLDLKTADGLEALMRLAERSDVLIYNVRPQAMARLGVTWEALSKRNPRLIMVGAFGYGQEGPYGAQPAYDDLIQGVLGLPSLLAVVGDGTPRYVPITMIDRTVALAACGAVTAALYRREKTGRGQAIEIPMFETMVPFVLGEHINGLAFEPPIGPPGYARLLSPERVPFPTLDGHVCALIYNDKHWRSFFAMLGQPERFDQDPRLADIGTRTEHIGDLYALVGDVMRTRTTAEWLTALAKADIPATQLHTIESLLKDPHLEAVGYFQHCEHPSEGPILQFSPIGRWSESPTSIRRMAPRLGEHSAQVLAELGYSDEQIAAMAAAGVTMLAPSI